LVENMVFMYFIVSYFLTIYTLIKLLRFSLRIAVYLFLTKLVFYAFFFNKSQSFFFAYMLRFYCIFHDFGSQKSWISWVHWLSHKSPLWIPFLLTEIFLDWYGQECWIFKKIMILWFFPYNNHTLHHLTYKHDNVTLKT